MESTLLHRFEQYNNTGSDKELLQFLKQHLQPGTFYHDQSGINRINGIGAMNQIERMWYQYGKLAGEIIGNELSEIFQPNNAIVIGLPEAAWAITEGLGQVLGRPIGYWNTGRYRTRGPNLLPEIEEMIEGSVILVEEVIHRGIQFCSVTEALRSTYKVSQVSGVVGIADSFMPQVLDMPMLIGLPKNQSPVGELFTIFD